MNKHDLMAIQFRDDLIQLLKEYNCAISGKNGDSGDIRIEFDCGQYIMKDYCSNYDLTSDYDNNYIIDEYILSHFPDTTETISKFDNKQIGIFTHNSQKAENKIMNIIKDIGTNNIEKLKKSKDHKELILKNGIRYMWVKPIGMTCGIRCSGAIIDRTVTLDEFHKIILPICVFCTKETVEVF